MRIKGRVERINEDKAWLEIKVTRKKCKVVKNLLKELR